MYNPPMAVIIKDSDILSGEPVFTGTRVPVKALFDTLSTGKSTLDFVQDFPTVSLHQVETLLDEAETAIIKNAEYHAHHSG